MGALFYNVSFMGQSDQHPPVSNEWTGAIPEQDQTERLRRKLVLEGQLNRPDLDADESHRLQLELAEVLLDISENRQACEQARSLFGYFIEQGQFEQAVHACQIIYFSEEPESVAALGQGLWLSITCPVPAEMTLQMLRSLIDETPERSDGAAVAAMLAYFLMQHRTSEGPERDRLVFLARQLVAEAAERHRGITGDEAIATWVEMHELDDVDLLLKRMAKIIDAITSDWWFDRDALKARFPDG